MTTEDSVCILGLLGRLRRYKSLIRYNKSIPEFWKYVIRFELWTYDLRASYDSIKSLATA